MIKVYLAIPYSGMENSAYNQVSLATAKLIETKKFNVFSPITHSHPLTLIKGVNLPGDWEYWQTIDKQFIDWADEVWALIPTEGPEKLKKSKGVKEELSYASEKGKLIRIGTLEEILKFKS